jgi:hypothetical protein
MSDFGEMAGWVETGVLVCNGVVRHAAGGHQYSSDSITMSTRTVTVGAGDAPTRRALLADGIGMRGVLCPAADACLLLVPDPEGLGGKRRYSFAAMRLRQGRK